MVKKTISIMHVILVLILDVNNSSAYDTGYYIKNMDVQVNVNDKREYNITETIKVNFNEERHGIIRKIPTYTKLENYNITNIDVVGAPYETEDSGAELQIKIGDKDKTLKGEQTYKISYTIENYNDEHTEGDYIYLNVLGTDWDTYIEKYTSTITYPKEAKLEKLTITDGEYGSTESTYVDYTTSNNKIEIKSKSKIPEYCGITVNAMLNEGVFKNAPEKTYPYTIKKDYMDIEITTEKEYIVSRKFEVEVNEDNLESCIYLWDIYSNDYIKDISCDDSNLYIDENNRSVQLPNKKGIYTFNVYYKIEPTLSSKISMPIISDWRYGKTEDINVNISSPFNINNQNINFYERGLNLGTNRYEVENKGKTIYFRNLNNISDGEEISIELDIDNSLFYRETPLIGKIATYSPYLILILVMILYIKYSDKNPRTPAIEFYPPKNMNSAEVAHVFRGSTNTRDITTLLYTWASDGYMKINIRKNKEFTLTKIKNLDNSYRDYEIKLFKRIFSYSKDRNTVKSEQLEGKIGDSISSAVLKVNKFFTGEHRLNDSKSFSKGALMTIVSSIPIILLNFYNGKLSHYLILISIVISIFSIIVLFIIFSILVTFNKNRYTKKGKRKLIIRSLIIGLLYIFIGFSLFKIYESEIDSYVIFINLIISYVGIFISSYIPIRSIYGKEVYTQIVGFRNFIEVAEKNRLEALLDEDPDYFYNTLPYAQALGVTKKWIDKFDGITIQPPTFCEADYAMDNAMAMSLFMNDLNKMNSKMTYVESENSSGGNSGGFGGGGFSGGGSGGGGGSSW